MKELAGYLKSLDPGPVEQTSHLERLVARVWDDLGGDVAAMTGHNLIGRIEHVEWHHPVLTFRVERHGGTILGSTRADIQQWTVDLEHQTATFERTGNRQLSPISKRVDVEPIADEVADSIVTGEADDRLTWLGDGRVRVQMGMIFPKRSGFKQTVQGRRTRLREALIERLSTRGWAHLGRNTFGQTNLARGSLHVPMMSLDAPAHRNPVHWGNCEQNWK